MKRLWPFLSPPTPSQRERSFLNWKSFSLAIAVVAAFIYQAHALTAADIISRSRLQLRDASADTTRQRFSDAQLLAWINDGQREANAFGFILQSSYTFQLVGGTTEYALPVDFLTPWRVTFKGNKIEQTSFNQQDANAIGWQNGRPGTPSKYYIYLASTPVIGFVPCPIVTATGTVTMWYLQQTIDMTLTTQVPFNGWTQLAPYHSGLAYYVTYRGLWTVGDVELAKQYLAEWQQWVGAIKVGIGKQPDFNPGMAGRRVE